MITGQTPYGTLYSWPPETPLRDVLADADYRGVVRIYGVTGALILRRLAGGGWCV